MRSGPCAGEGRFYCGVLGTLGEWSHSKHYAAASVDAQRHTPAHRAASAASPWAKTPTRTARPVPCGSVVTPRTIWSPRRGSVPRFTATSTVSSNLARARSCAHPLACQTLRESAQESGIIRAIRSATCAITQSCLRCHVRHDAECESKTSLPGSQLRHGCVVRVTRPSLISEPRIPKDHPGRQAPLLAAARLSKRSAPPCGWCLKATAVAAAACLG